MIKVTVGEQKTQSEKPFPKLMKSKVSGAIVYFTKESYGLVIIESYGTGGDFNSSASGWNMTNFTDYNEPITIQNA
jgi:hypothetical protein